MSIFLSLNQTLLEGLSVLVTVSKVILAGLRDRLHKLMSPLLQQTNVLGYICGITTEPGSTTRVGAETADYTVALKPTRSNVTEPVGCKSTGGSYR